MTDNDTTRMRPSDSWSSLTEAVNYSVGAASTCWKPDTGDAEFDSTRALEVGAELLRYIEIAFDTALQPQRSKGEKIVAECLQSDEPFFVFRGQDILTPLVLTRYVKALEEIGPDDPDMQKAVIDFLNMVRKWQAKNISKVRYPD